MESGIERCAMLITRSGKRTEGIELNRPLANSDVKYLQGMK